MTAQYQQGCAGPGPSETCGAVPNGVPSGKGGYFATYYLGPSLTLTTLLPITVGLVSPLIILPNPLSQMALIEGTNVSEENGDCVDDGKVF